MNSVQDIRSIFVGLYKNEMFNDSGLLEIIGASFIANDDTIFGVPNFKYIEKEIMWYNSKSRNVYDMHNPPEIWKSVADKDGNINSNYGWCIYSKDNHNQYHKALKHLKDNPNSRQAIMIYNRPTMHEDCCTNGMSDFMCTNAVIYKIDSGYLHAIVQMRSNDAVFGYKNDYAWQRYVLEKMAKDLNVMIGDIYWQVASLHIYPRHFHLIK